MPATDDRADRLAAIAVELATRVRDDDPAANARWLHATTTPEDRFALLFVLAAAIPDDRPWLHLTAWTVQPAQRHHLRLAGRCPTHSRPAVADHGDRHVCDKCLSEEATAA